MTSLRQELQIHSQKIRTSEYELQSKLNHAEQRVATLETAAQQQASKTQRLEAERDGLKLKVQSLLEVSHQCQALGINISDVAASIEGTAPLASGPKAPTGAEASLNKGGISLVKASAARVAALESELGSFRAKSKENEELIASLKDACAEKDGELASLRAKVAAAKGGSELASFQQLTEHANSLARELESLRQRVVDPQALAAAEEGRQAAESRAAIAESNLQIAVAELESFKQDLDKLRRDSEASTSAEAKAVKLRVALDEAKTREAAACAAAELAEGRAADLQDRLERRDATLEKAQARCRSLSAELHRLRQLQGLKASQKGGEEKNRKMSQGANDESDNKDDLEIMQLKSQCAAMAGHLQKAMELQAAAMEAVTAATAERDEVAAEAIKLKTELEDAQIQLQEAAAAAAAVRYRIAGTSPGGKLDLDEKYHRSSSAMSEEIAAIYGSVSSETPSKSLFTSLLKSGEESDVLHKLASRLQAATYQVAELQVEVAAEREKADLLRKRCASLEAQPGSSTTQYLTSQSAQGNYIMGAEPSSDFSDNPPPTAPEPSQHYTPLPKGTGADTSSDTHKLHYLEAELQKKRLECEQLAAAGAQADAAMADVLHQLRAATAELHESRAAAAASHMTVNEWNVQLQAAQAAVQALERERTSLREELVAAQTATERATESFTTQLEAEREAAAGDFDTLRSNMQCLSRQYQEVSAQLAAALQERDAAAQLAESAATEAVFHEQTARAKEMELQEAANMCRSLAEENRQLQGVVMELQRELATRASQDRFGNERAQAALQRRAATAEGGQALLEARLADAQGEAAALRQRLAAQAHRSEELEALLAEERAKQFQQESGGGLGLLQFPEISAVETHRGPDAVDEALMQRLAELESECQRLRSDLQEERQRASEAAEDYNGSRIDLLAELAQISGRLQEEQRRREDLQAMVQVALDSHAQSKAEASGGSPDATKKVMKQLKHIAQGLQGLGRR